LDHLEVFTLLADQACDGECGLVINPQRW